MSTTSKSPWPHLPNKPLSLIANLIVNDSWLGYLRLNSVCSSWRAALKPHLKPIFFPVHLPFFNPMNSPNNPISSGHYSLTHNTKLYLLFPQGQNHTDFHGLRVTLVFTGDKDSSFIRLHDHPTNVPLDYSNKTINMLDYGLLPCVSSKVSGFYNFDIVQSKEEPLIHNCLKKYMSVAVWRFAVALNFFQRSDIALVIMTYEGKLGFWVSGHDNWSEIDNRGFMFDDVVFRDKKFYAVDRNGNLAMIDLQLLVVKIEPAILNMAMNMLTPTAGIETT